MNAVALGRTVQPAAGPRLVADPAPFARASAIEPWELHSELMYVDPEVRAQALELLPERHPVAALPRPPSKTAAPSVPAVVVEAPVPLRASPLRYALLRLGDTVRLGLAIVGAVFALAMLAEVLSH